MKSVSDLSGNEKHVVFYFSAAWCVNCKTMVPGMEKLEAKYPTVCFVKVDVDVDSDLADEHEINLMPTIIFMSKGVVQKELRVEGSELNSVEMNVKIMIGVTCF